MMQKRWLFLAGLVLVAAMVAFLVARAVGGPGPSVLSLDEPNNARLPGNFRMITAGILHPAPGAPLIIPTGLADLNISGSGQFSQRQLRRMKDEIDRRRVMVVDLRQESHGFLNGMAVSWVGKHNAANQGLSLPEILRDERRKLTGLIRADGVKVSRAATNAKVQPLVLHRPLTVCNEAELVRSVGWSYARLPVTDHQRPSDPVVDQFISLVRGLPADAWLHFHCRAGIGRTTILMQMYDMMRNAKQVPFEAIISRQAWLASRSVVHDVQRRMSSRSRGSLEIKDFLQRFYLYCQSNRDQYRTSWTQWLKMQRQP